MSRNILVVGGTGTMGKPLVDLLLNNGDNVFVVCRRPVSDNRIGVSYYYGNAKDKNFMKSEVLSKFYDCIVDFCLYNSKEFSDRYEDLLQSTSQYICLSSGAVYADQKPPKTEESPRYMESAPPILGDYRYYWYCYEKARIEDILLTCSYNNWVIVRPGITIGPKHFFWGFWYDEEWTHRIINGQQVIIPEDLLNYKASISYGGDVSKLIMGIIGNPSTLKKLYNVTAENSITWGDFLEMWKKSFEKYGYHLNVKKIKDSRILYTKSPWKGREYGYIRARLLDRTFDSSKVYQISKPIFVSIQEKLDEWIHACINQSSFKIRRTKIASVARIDILTGEHTRRCRFLNSQDYLLYLGFRYIPLLFYNLLEWNAQRKKRVKII